MTEENGKKIGEVVEASVSRGINIKLGLSGPEDIKTGYPVIVEGEKFDFYSIVMDVYNPQVGVINEVATSPLAKSAIPAVSRGMQKGYLGNLFYTKALLEPIQIISKKSGELSEVETIPQYFSEVRFATAKDVSLIYQPTTSSMPLGHLRGIPEFNIPIDFEKLTEKAFAILGRTGMGKSFLNKIICNFVLHTGVASVFVFDMHGEYGMYSSTDNSRGLKFYFPEKIDWFTLDPGRNKEASQFFIDPKSITPEDLILALPDLSERMRDAIWEINRAKDGDDLLNAIDTAQASQTIPESTLRGLQARVGRLNRLEFIRETPATMKEDPFSSMFGGIKKGQSIVLDFGKFGKNSMVYLFIANIISRHLLDLYERKNDELPRLVVFVEEAHKFLDPSVAGLTIFGMLAREMRKFNLIVSLVDQRPSRIDDEVLSQLGNRIILSLKDPNDLRRALSGIPKAEIWGNIVQTIPSKTAFIVGDAVRVPTVIEVLDYEKEIQDLLKVTSTGKPRQTNEDIQTIAKHADKILKSIK